MIKIEYYIYEELIFVDSTTVVPAAGDVVILDEEYYVENVVWFPKQRLVRIELVQDLKKEKKEVTENVSTQFTSRVNKIEESLSVLENQVKSVNSQLLTVRQRLRNKDR